MKRILVTCCLMVIPWQAEAAARLANVTVERHPAEVRVVIELDPPVSRPFYVLVPDERSLRLRLEDVTAEETTVSCNEESLIRVRVVPRGAGATIVRLDPRSGVGSEALERTEVLPDARGLVVVLRRSGAEQAQYSRRLPGAGGGGVASRDADGQAQLLALAGGDASPSATSLQFVAGVDESPAPAEEPGQGPLAQQAEAVLSPSTSSPQEPEAEQGPPAEEASAGTASFDWGWHLPERWAREIPLAALIVIGALLMVAGAMVWRPRAGWPRASRRGHASGIELVATKRIGEGHSLFLVEVDGQKLLLGATEAHMTRLAAWQVGSDGGSTMSSDSSSGGPAWRELEHEICSEDIEGLLRLRQAAEQDQYGETSAESEVDDGSVTEGRSSAGRIS